MESILGVYDGMEAARATQSRRTGSRRKVGCPIRQSQPGKNEFLRTRTTETQRPGNAHVMGSSGSSAGT